MKRLIPLILSFLALSLSFSVKAQTFDEQLKRAESIKKQYGETDDRYLDALSKAIQAAFSEHKNEDANQYRLIHAEIVKGKFGEISLEYAEDLWRLGNVSTYKGESYTFDCYKRAEGIYEKVNAQNEFPYCDILWRCYLHYYDSQNWYLALKYLKNHIVQAQTWVNKDWKGNTFSELDIAHLYLLLGNLYRYEIQDLSSSTDAYMECITRLEAKNLLEQYEYAEFPYRGIVLNYADQNNPQEKLPWAVKYVDILKLKKGELSEEYLKEFANLQYAFWEVQDIHTIRRLSNELDNLLTQRANRDGRKVTSDSLYVFNHELRLSVCVATKDNPGIIESAKQLLSIYDDTSQSETSAYCDALDNLILAYHNTQDELNAYLLFDKYEELCEKLGTKRTAAYCSYLGNKAEILTFLNKKEEFTSTIEELAPLTLSLYGEYSLNAILLDYTIANQYASTDDYSMSEQYVRHGIDIMTSGKCEFSTPTDSILLSSGLHNIEGMINTRRDPAEAERLLNLALSEWESSGRKDYSIYVNLGKLYIEQKRDFDGALEYFETAKEILEQSGYSSSPQYLTVLNNYGLCLQELGRNSEAIAIFDSACRIAEESYGKLHPSYAMAIQNKANFLAITGDYQSSIALGKEALECMAGIYGDRSEKYGLTLQNQGNNYHKIGDNAQAERCFKQSIDIFEELGSKVYLLYSYSNLLNVYSVQGRWNDFDVIAQQCEKILSDPLLEESDLRATVDVSIGYAAFKRGNSDAQKYFARAVQNMGKAKGKTTLEYLYCLLYYEMACKYKNEELTPQIIHQYKALYSNDIAFMNANERESIVTGDFFNPLKNVVFSSRQTSANDGDLYDYLLFSKGLLLGTSMNYAKYIYNSDNQKIKGEYADLLELNKYTSGVSNGLSSQLSIDEAREKATSIERNLIAVIRNSPDFSQAQITSYQDIKRALKRDEVAIEFVNYFDYSENSIIYAALLIRNNKTNPEYVKLCTQSKLEHYLTISPNRLYAEGVPSEELYNLIWQPLQPYLKSTKTVFFSPSGLLNLLAIEYLFDGDKRIDEIYDVIRMTSTREICATHTKFNFETAVLYGGLTYDEDEETMISESRKIRGDSTPAASRFRGLTDSGTRRGWNYLPGTLNEVTSISSIASSNGIDSKLYTGQSGNEESFKALSGQDFCILHIATHGFFLTSTQAEKNEFLSANPAALDANKNESSLSRSGLLLAGGNRAWRGESIPEGVEDGVLTSTEVSDLDFNHCDVVVLSACETGLGEITDEGVFGLQRAFKNAGANTIVMSLWEVDDNATSLMMQSFYGNLAKGKSKRDSFTIAQDEVRREYPDPRYWAAFIMLD